MKSLDLPRVDYHTHNGFYRGQQEMWACHEGWEQAARRGVERLGIANKIEFNHPRHDFIPILRQEIDALGNPAILLGVELDIGDVGGKHMLPPECVPMLDFVIAGAHNQPVETLAWPDIQPADLEEYFDSYSDILYNTLKNAPVDIWAHPFLQEVEWTAGRYWNYLEPIFHRICGLCAEQGIALEINENYFRRRAPPPQSARWWHSAAAFVQEEQAVLRKMFGIARAQYNVNFTFASDTHHLENVGEIRAGRAFAKALPIPPGRILIIHKQV